MATPSDRASDVAAELQAKYEAQIERGEVFLDDEPVMNRDAKKGVFAKIEFRWRADDAKIIEQIRAGVDYLFAEMFTDTFAVMDEFYGAMRIPDTVDGVVKTDSAGRVLWKKDSGGREIEDWGQLTGQDIEKALLDITRLKLILAPQQNDLLLEAVFAKYIAEDKSHEAYSALLDGTVKDREAYASRESRQDKYHAFFRYYLYSHAEVFMRELTNFARILERIRYWRIDDDGKKTP
jgi:hypothetical protein